MWEFNGKSPVENQVLDPVFFDPDDEVPLALTEVKVKELAKLGLDVDRVLRALGYEEEEGLPKLQGIPLEAPCPCGTNSEFITSFPDPSPTKQG